MAFPFIIVGIMYIFLGGVMAALSLPLINRQVKMNPLYGVRIAKAFTSEEAWYAINEYGGRLLLSSSYFWFGGGIIALLLAFVMPSEMLSPSLMFSILVIVPISVTVYTLILIFRFAKRF
jgi:hypothetical protein